MTIRSIILGLLAAAPVADGDILPQHIKLLRRRPSVIEDVPPRMLAEVRDDRIGPGPVKKFVTRLPEGNERIKFSDIP